MHSGGFSWADGFAFVSVCNAAELAASQETEENLSSQKEMKCFTSARVLLQ